MSPMVLARLTIVREDGSRIIVEVHADATFSAFYRFFTQQGRKRSTRKFLRSASRNEGLQPSNAHLQVPGLEMLMYRFVHNKFGSPVKSTQIRFFSKKAYRKLLHMAPDQLGQSTVKALFDKLPKHSMPIGPLTFKRVEKMNHFKLHAGAMR